MPIALQPQICAEVMDPGLADGFQFSPPVGWHSAAVEWNEESGTGLVGRFDKSTGEVQGKATPKMQSTTLYTSLNTGRVMDVVSGTWKDDWVASWSNQNGVLMQDATAGAAWEVVDHAETNGGLTHQYVRIGRGDVAPGGTHTPAAVYAYLELAYGETDSNYRIALVWGQPIRLDFYRGGWQEGVAVAKDLGNLETILQRTRGIVDLHIMPNALRHMMLVEVDSGHFLRHTPTPTDRYADVGELPSIERYRFYGANGWASLETYPLRYGAVTVNKSPRAVPVGVPVQSATLTANSTAPQNVEQTETGSVTQNPDGTVQWSATAQVTDAGDSLGSATPPTYSDVFCYIPAVWGTRQTFTQPVEQLPVLQWHEHGVFDPITRMHYHTDRFVVRNRDGHYDNWPGNCAYNLVGGSGSGMAQRNRGIIAPGFTRHRQDPVRLMECTGHDNSYKLQVPLGQRVIFDGWCIYAAVRYVLECGQISPAFMGAIPDWAPGPAGYDCPYQILGRGTGANPLYEYGPERTCLSILLELVQDAAFISSWGTYAAFYTGQDPWGNWLFGPWDPRYLPLRKTYSQIDPSGASQIQSLTVSDSTADMRTELNFQGQDPYTGELLYVHRDLSWNLPIVGYRYGWTERNPRWSSLAYMEKLADAASFLASMPVRTVRMQVPYDPWVNAGDLIYVDDPAGFYVILDLQSTVGLADVTGRSGEQIAVSHVTAQSAETLIAG